MNLEPGERVRVGPSRPGRRDGYTAEVTRVHVCDCDAPALVDVLQVEEAEPRAYWRQRTVGIDRIRKVKR